MTDLTWETWEAGYIEPIADDIATAEADVVDLIEQRQSVPLPRML